MSIDNIIAFLNMCVTTLDDSHFKMEEVLPPFLNINKIDILGSFT